MGHHVIRPWKIIYATPDSQSVDELVDRASAAGPGEDNGVVLGGVDGVAQHVPRLVSEHRSLQERIRVKTKSQLILERLRDILLVANC